jgi:predicted  nucleic acid-binding Zn-ribbon protein
MQGFNQIDTRSGGVLVNVRINARLQRLRDQQDSLRKQAESFRRQVAQAEAELSALDQRTAGISDVADLHDIASKRQTLKSSCDELERRQRDAEAQQKRVAEENEAWVDNFAQWTFRRQQLIKELASAPDGAESNYMAVMGVGEIRSRATVEAELKDIVFKLENFSK